MSYLRQPYRGLSGVDDPVCRTGAPFEKSGSWWVPIRDGAGKEYPLMQTSAILALPVCPTATAKSEPSWLDKLLGATTEVIKAKVTPGGTTVIQSTPSSGMSTTTKVAIAGAAAVGLVLVLRTMKK